LKSAKNVTWAPRTLRIVVKQLPNIGQMAGKKAVKKWSKDAQLDERVEERKKRSLDRQHIRQR
jgi:hypothetical protein